jgi:hypothetical protein
MNNRSWLYRNYQHLITWLLLVAMLVATLTIGAPINPQTEGPAAMAINFDGSDDYLTPADSAALDNMSALTVCVWARPETWISAGVRARMVAKTNYVSMQVTGWQFGLSNDGANGYSNALTFARIWSTSGGQWRANDAVALNEWRHYCVTYDASSTSNDPVFYMNGAAQVTGEVAAPAGSYFDDTPVALNIGRLEATGELFDGQMAGILIFNRALTAAEIKDIYQSRLGLPATPGLVFALPGLVPGGVTVPTLYDSIGGLAVTPSGSPTGHSDPNLTMP